MGLTHHHDAQGEKLEPCSQWQQQDSRLRSNKTWEQRTDNILTTNVLKELKDFIKEFPALILIRHDYYYSAEYSACATIWGKLPRCRSDSDCHKRNYFNPHIVVLFGNCGHWRLLWRTLGSFRPAQLAFPLGWSALCRYKQLLYQQPCVDNNGVMLNEY